MKSKDQQLLEEAYQKILIKEDPDECMIGRNEIESLGFGSPGAMTFGFCNIGTNPFAVKSHYGDDMYQLEGFDNSNYGKLLTSEKIHGAMAQEIFKNFVSKSPIGKITFLDNFNIFGKGEGFDEGEIIDLSNPAQAKRIKEFFSYILSHKEDQLDYSPRTFLLPAGRIWVRQKAIKDIYQKEFQANIDSVISFWADKDKVTPKHFQDLVAHFKLSPQNTMVEFLGDVEPSTRLDAIVGSSNTPQPDLSKEEQEEREKRKAASLAKVHAAAAVGTKDKDVQDIVDQRKKAMTDRESQLRASGVRPSLAQRQQAMSSESYIVSKPNDQILLEQAYQAIYKSKQ